MQLARKSSFGVTDAVSGRLFTNRCVLQVKKRLKAAKQRQSIMYRSLLISLINLSCNLPSHLLRAVWTLEVDLSFIPTIGMRYIEGISQLLYFAQFGCNAFYLSTAIYETSTPSRPLAKQINFERRSSVTVESGHQCK